VPLPKRGPHLRKRPPSPSPPRPQRCAQADAPSVGRSGGVPQRRPGRTAAQARARERATRPGEAASPTGPRSSTQSLHQARRTDRTEPIEPAPTPDPAFSLSSLVPIPRPPYPRLTPRRLDGRPTALKSDTNPPVTPALPVAAAPPPAHQHPPGQTRTTFTWHVEEGGPAQRAGPPSSKAQAGSEKRPWAGRRPVRA
jgi:hypothetical protein